MVRMSFSKASISCQAREDGTKSALRGWSQKAGSQKQQRAVAEILHERNHWEAFLAIETLGGILTALSGSNND